MTNEGLRAVRRQLGIGQRALAKMLGTSQGHLGDIERGHKRVTREMEVRVLALVRSPTGRLCETCLCVIAGGVCGCREVA